MTRFPYAPVELSSEMWIGDQYRSIMPDLQAKPVTIVTGRANEAGLPAPTSSGFTMNNPDSVYSPRNPTGPYFEQLGRNTPLRQAIRNDHDEFDRAVSNGWGTSTGGMVWVREGTASDYSVTSGTGRHSLPTTNSFRATSLSGSAASWRTVRTAATVALPGITAVTGGNLEPTLTVRRLSSTDYYLVRCNITPFASVELQLLHYSGESILSPQTILLDWAGEPLRIAALIEGHSLFGKVWRPATEPEPYGWHVQGTIRTSTLPAAGTIGVRSGVASGNTNAGPIVFAYDDIEVCTPLAFTEVAKWPQKQDKSGIVRTVTIDAKGITRRLGQGKAALRSTLYRGITSQAPDLLPVAYWSCEDGKTATTYAPGFSDGIPMRIVGTPTGAAYTDFASSAAIPELRKSMWIGDVVPYVSTDEITVQFLVHFPDGGTVDDSVIMRLFTSGTPYQWDLIAFVDGSLALRAYDRIGGQVLDTGPVTFDANGLPLRMAMSLAKNGSGVDWLFSTIDARDIESAGFFSGTLASSTVGSAVQVQANPQQLMDQVAMGHIEVYPRVQDVFTLWQQLNAYIGESAGIRVRRLCEENGIVFVPIGDPDDSTFMGPQTPDTLLNLIQECVLCDGGLLFEPAGLLGIGYRTRTTLFNQGANLTTAYGNLSEIWEPVEDDQATRNDITVERKGGSSARATQTTGPLSILPPELGGVGIYDSKVTVNCAADTQLPHIAWWLLHLGTVDEPRYPQLKLNLASPGFAASDALTVAALALTQGDRLVITAPPPGGAPDDIEQLVQGITRTIATWDYRIALTCTPASPWQVLQLGTATARLAPSDSVLTDAETSGDATVRLTTNSGPVWTVSGGDMPIPLTVSGERMLATAISGASSPQTATMTRSLNAVVKAQGAGTDVQLTFLPVLARGGGGT